MDEVLQFLDINEEKREEEKETTCRFSSLVFYSTYQKENFLFFSMTFTEGTFSIIQVEISIYEG